MRVALVMVGGGLGSAARYLLGTFFAAQYGGGFPWATLTINVAGSFLIGILATLADEPGSIGIGPSLRVFLVVGLLGGFTTVSAFSLESVRLIEDGQVGRALQRLKAHKYFEYAVDPQGQLQWNRRDHLIQAEAIRDGLYLLSTDATIHERGDRVTGRNWI